MTPIEEDLISAAVEHAEIEKEEALEQARAEQVELQAWTERSVRMVHYLDKKFSEAEKQGERQLSLQSLVKDKSRRVVAGTFFEFLVLKTKNLIDLKQDEPYGEIKLTKTVCHISSSFLFFLYPNSSPPPPNKACFPCHSRYHTHEEERGRGRSLRKGEGGTFFIFLFLVYLHT